MYENSKMRGEKIADFDIYTAKQPAGAPRL